MKFGKPLQKLLEQAAACQMCASHALTSQVPQCWASDCQKAHCCYCLNALFANRQLQKLLMHAKSFDDTALSNYTPDAKDVKLQAAKAQQEFDAAVRNTSATSSTFLILSDVSQLWTSQLLTGVNNRKLMFHCSLFVCQSSGHFQSQDPHCECTGCCREDGRKFLPPSRDLIYKNSEQS